MLPDYNKLDNPAWHALTEKHAAFATGTNVFKRYKPEIVLFAGFPSASMNISAEFDKAIGISESFFLFDKFPTLAPNYIIETTVECLQMVCTKPLPVHFKEDIVQLSLANEDEMFGLISEVFPGYYQQQTYRMGNYYGIFKNGRLIAMAGERLCIDGLTEISAVATQPAFTGRGYAQQLMAYINQLHVNNGIVSFLHTGSNNARAISIYEMLGYKKRRIINVTKIRRLQ